MVGEPADVEQVVLGGSGILERIRPGAVIVDMTTSEPSLASVFTRKQKANPCHHSMPLSRAVM